MYCLKVAYVQEKVWLNHWFLTPKTVCMVPQIANLAYFLLASIEMNTPRIRNLSNLLYPLFSKPFSFSEEIDNKFFSLQSYEHSSWSCFLVVILHHAKLCLMRPEKVLATYLISDRCPKRCMRRCMRRRYKVYCNCMDSGIQLKMPRPVAKLKNTSRKYWTARKQHV